MLKYGIDPGESTGVAVYSPGQGILALHTFSFWETIAHFQEIRECKIYIEDPGANLPVFNRSGYNSFSHLKIAQNVGMNKCCAKLMAEGLERQGHEVIRVKPLQGILKTWKKCKMNFESMTKWAGPSNEHARDAAALVWGR